MASGAAGPEARASERIPFEEARRRVLAVAPALAARLEREAVPLAACVGRVLAEPLAADVPFPRFANSAVDGYAVCAADVARASPENPVRLRVLERVPAGRAPSRALEPGTSTLVMTGAPLPDGAECVVMREHTREGERYVEVLAPCVPRENVRPAGEDLAAGEIALERGRVLRPGDVAVLAALGRPTAEVVRRVRVAILSTGDELREPGEPLAPGEIYDSNSYALAALAAEAGAECAETRRVRDDPREAARAIRELLETNDVVLSLGGVSMGDFDVVRQALGEFPELSPWRVAMRPGGPQVFGTREGRVFYGLPGNPVSSAVVFDRLARPLVRAAMGARPADRPTDIAALEEPISSRRGRRDFVRVRLSGRPGARRARLTGTQSSGAVSSLAKADALAVIPEEVDRLEAGSTVEVILWDEI